MPYQAIDCCEHTRSSDALFARYSEERQSIVALMKRDGLALVEKLWSYHGFLCRDDYCQCSMGTNHMLTSQACAQCTNMRRLIDFRYSPGLNPFIIKYGQLAGRKMIVKRMRVGAPRLRVSPAYTQHLHQYAKQYDGDVSDITVINGDVFTISVLVHMALSRYMAENDLPHVQPLYTAFICRDDGYKLTEVSDMASLEELHQHGHYHQTQSDMTTSKHSAYGPLKVEVVQTIIQQLLVILLELSEVNFAQKHLSLHNIAYCDQPVSYLYDDVTVCGPLTLQWVNFNQASATLENYHYCCDNISSHGIMSCPFEVRNLEKFGQWYRLSSNNLEHYQELRSLGLPLFTQSFEFYYYITGLMCDQSFYTTVMQNNDLRRLWKMLWTQEDRPKIEAHITDYHSRAIHNFVSEERDKLPLNILRGAWLRVDVIEYTWSSFVL